MVVYAMLTHLWSPPCWLSVGCDGNFCSVLSGFDLTSFSNSASLVCYLGSSKYKRF